jgi:hypothetical protein
MAVGVVQTWLGTGRWCGQFGWPVLAAVIARPGGRTARARWGRRLAAASLLAAPPLADGARQGGGARLLAAAGRTLADQAAYGAGVLRRLPARADRRPAPAHGGLGAGRRAAP